MTGTKHFSDLMDKAKYRTLDDDEKLNAAMTIDHNRQTTLLPRRVQSYLKLPGKSARSKTHAMQPLNS